MMARANLITTFIALTAPLSALAQPAAPIKEVVVYADRAQVTRGQTVDCARGEAVFAGLPSNLQTKTLWASLAGGGGGEVVGLTHREVASGPRPEARALQDQVRAIDEALATADADLQAAKATASKLRTFRQHMQQVWGLQAASRNPPVGSWDAALDLLRQQELAAGVRERQALSQSRDLSRKRERLQAELRTIEQKRRRTTIEAVALIKCAGRRTVELSYVVPHATWEMGYQLRADPRSGRVTLVVQAAVHQGTGEDWNNVTLAVSTANLQRRNLPPNLQRMKVTTFEPQETRKVLTRRFERRRHLTTATTSQLQEATLKAPDQPSGGEAGVPDSGIAFKLTAAARVSVPGDGRRTMVDLQRRTVKGDYTLETVPKLFPFVYNKVSLINPFGFTLLPGKVSLFEGRAFLGRTAMKLRAPKEPLEFSLGVEKQLQVNRYVKKERVEGKRGYGNEKKLRHRYQIQVGNWTDKRRKVRVLENVPVSQVREVEVTLSDDTTKPGKWDKTDGILTWDLTLSPRSKKELILDYTVHLPKSYIVQGY